MGTVHAAAEGTVDRPADTVYGYLADMRRHHPHFLPPAFSGFEVVAGGFGAGTITRFTVTAGGRSRQYQMTVSEPEPGRVLVETDANSSLVTTWTVTPTGRACVVRIATSWQGAGGIGGFFERRFAPKALRSIYLDELRRLNDYACRQDAAQDPDGGPGADPDGGPGGDPDGGSAAGAGR